MTLIPFPSARTRHPSGAHSASSLAPSRFVFVEDAAVYGVFEMPTEETAIASARVVAKQHLFRLGFGEIPAANRVRSDSPIVARREGETIGVVVVPDGMKYDGETIARAEEHAYEEGREGDDVCAAVMSVKFFGEDRLRVEITVAGTESLKSIPRTPVE